MSKTASQRGRASKNKGKVGEREVAAMLREYGFEARRGQQFAGGTDSPDVVHSMEGFHIEVKRTETLSLYAAMDQAKEDKKPNETPLVFHRRSNKDWLVIMPAADFLTHAQELYEDEEV